MLFVTPPLAFGVLLRIVGQPYRAADLMLEGSFLLGLLGGRVVGPLGGSIISLPAFLHHEWLSMPVAATAGLVGGLIRQFMPNTEEIWKLGPFTFMSTPRSSCAYSEEKNWAGKCCRWRRASCWNWRARRLVMPPSPDGCSIWTRDTLGE